MSLFTKTELFIFGGLLIVASPLQFLLAIVLVLIFSEKGA